MELKVERLNIFLFSLACLCLIVSIPRNVEGSYDQDDMDEDEDAMETDERFSQFSGSYEEDPDDSISVNTDDIWTLKTEPLSWSRGDKSTCINYLNQAVTNAPTGCCEMLYNPKKCSSMSRAQSFFNSLMSKRDNDIQKIVLKILKCIGAFVGFDREHWKESECCGLISIPFWC